MKILVIVPAYNESENLDYVCEVLTKAKKESNYDIDYIIINDGSTDNTKELCEKKKYPVINLVHNLGIGGAVQTGYKYALKNNYDVAIQFDGDGQHDATYIDNLAKPIIENKCHMTVGSRYVKNSTSKFKSTKLRQTGIKFLSFILKITTHQKIYDMTSGFRAVNKSIIKLFASDYPNDYPEPETLVTVIKKGYKVKEVPVVMHERRHGKSSITPLKSIYYMLKVSYAMIVRSIIEGDKK
jgi:glycosyltransferase involved in cell wall biosynthesis